MTVYLALLLTALALALMITPVVTSASLALGLVDAPGGRKVHSTSVPRVGGVAVALATAIALAGTAAVLRARDIDSPSLGALLPVLFGTSLVFVTGLFDDLVGLPVWPRVSSQVIAAGIVMGSGLLIERVTILDQTWHLGLLSWPVTIVWIVGLTNAFNLIDGIDGLAAGIAVIAGATCAVILIGRGHAGEAMLLAAIVGAALGFLAFNFSPASIFLGDCGSLAFGFVLATTAITGWQKGATALAAGVPILIFALPITDAFTTLVRRSSRRGETPRGFKVIMRQISEPDRQHIHHRMVALGWSTRRIVLMLYGLTALLSCAAYLTARFV